MSVLKLNKFWWSPSDLAIDLGTSHCLVYSQERGLIINEPSVVALEISKNNSLLAQAKMLAMGIEAKNMLGRTPDSIKIVYPLIDGVVANFDVTKSLLSFFIKKATQEENIFKKMIRPRIIIAVPNGITQVERRAVRESALEAGAREVYLVEEPFAAAIGAGLPVIGPQGNLIINIGGGATEVAVVSLGGIVYSQSVRVAGNSCDEAIMNFIKKKYHLLIGKNTAEQIKIDIGNAYPVNDGLGCEVKGRDLVTGSPKVIHISSTEVREAMNEPIMAILATLRHCLEKTPPELSSDIFDNGIFLTGGGSLLKNLDGLLREKTGLPVTIADDPMTCVVRGCGIILNSPALLSTLTI